MVSQPQNKKIWLITGASSGLGQAMAFAALRAGHGVIGTGRNISQAAKDNPDFEELGGTWLQLDVAQSSTVQVLGAMVEREEKKLAQADSIHWVVVNNAGFSLQGTVEEASEGQLLDYLDANVLGVIRVWKAMMPVLRRHRTGTVITMSSVYGMIGEAGHMMYSAAKATLESLTESYCALVAPFGINMLIVQPGGFRTNFASNKTLADGKTPEDYREKMDQWSGIINAIAANPALLDGSPEKLGDAIVDAVQNTGLFEGLWDERDPGQVLRIPLGSDCFAMISRKMGRMNKEFSKMADIAKSTDHSPLN